MDDRKKPPGATLHGRSRMETGEVKILAEETLYQGFIHLSRVTVEVPTREGTPMVQIREIHDHGNAAVVLPVDYQHHSVLLIKQWRIPPLYNQHAGPMIEAVAGLIDPHETPKECAIREALEETGFEVKNLQKITECYSSPGTLTEYFHLFAGEYDHYTPQHAGGGLRQEGEDIALVELDFDALRALLNEGKIRDAKTLLAINWLFSKTG